MKKLAPILIAAALSILTMHLVCHAAGTTVTPAQYARALGAVKDKLDSAAVSVDAGNDIDNEMPGDTAKRVLGPIDSIREADGGIEVVDTKSLTASITSADNAKTADDQSAAYKGVSRRIGVIREEVLASANLPSDDSSAGKRGVPLPAEKSRDIARRILSGNDFASEPVPPPSWLERQFDHFGKWLERTLNKLFKRPARNMNMQPVNPMVWWVLLWVIVAALFVFLVWIIAQIIGRRQRRMKPLALSDSEEALVDARDKDTLMSLAEKHAKAGDYRAAFRLVYISTLIALDTDGILRFDRSKTNWEYVRQLRSSGRVDIYEVLMPLTRDFDRTWYGLSPTTPDVYRKAVVEYEKLTTPAEKATAA